VMTKDEKLMSLGPCSQTASAAAQAELRAHRIQGDHNFLEARLYKPQQVAILGFNQHSANAADPSTHRSPYP
ncbi:MAG: hypothetical protein SGPRY_014700, partial [Prymnesium sp.]